MFINQKHLTLLKRVFHKKQPPIDPHEPKKIPDGFEVVHDQNRQSINHASSPQIQQAALSLATPQGVLSKTPFAVLGTYIQDNFKRIVYEAFVQSAIKMIEEYRLHPSTLPDQELIKNINGLMQIRQEMLEEGSSDEQNQIRFKVLEPLSSGEDHSSTAKISIQGKNVNEIILQLYHLSKGSQAKQKSPNGTILDMKPDTEAHSSKTKSIFTPELKIGKIKKSFAKNINQSAYQIRFNQPIMMKFKIKAIPFASIKIDGISFDINSAKITPYGHVKFFGLIPIPLDIAAKFTKHKKYLKVSPDTVEHLRKNPQLDIFNIDMTSLSLSHQVDDNNPQLPSTLNFQIKLKTHPKEQSLNPTEITLHGEWDSEEQWLKINYTANNMEFARSLADTTVKIALSVAEKKLYNMRDNASKT